MRIGQSKGFQPPFLGFFGLVLNEPYSPLEAIANHGLITQISLACSVYAAWKLWKSCSRNGLILNSGSWPGSPFFLYIELSLMWRNFNIMVNRSRFITCKVTLYLVWTIVFDFYRTLLCERCRWRKAKRYSSGIRLMGTLWCPSQEFQQGSGEILVQWALPSASGELWIYSRWYSSM